MNNARNKILTSRGSFPSCKLIRSAIEEITGKRYFITDDPQRVRNILFRYGNPSTINGEDTQFNSPEFIRLVANKKNFSEFCREKEIYSPIYYTHETRPTEFPIIIRTTLTGFGGIGIIVCRNEEEYNRSMRNHYWWTKFIPCKFELRVHLFKNRVNRIYKKVQPENENEFPIRNSENGYHFSLNSDPSERYPKAVELAEQLGNFFVEKGGNFSALDFGWDHINKKYFVFEANSAPGLSTINAGEYARFLVENLGIGG